MRKRLTKGNKQKSKRTELSQALIDQFVARNFSYYIDGVNCDDVSIIWIDGPKTEKISTKLSTILGGYDTQRQMDHDYLRLIRRLNRNWTIQIQIMYLKSTDIVEMESIDIEVENCSLDDPDFAKVIDDAKNEMISEITKENTVIGIQWLYTLTKQDNETTFDSICQHQAQSFVDMRIEQLSVK